MKVSVYWGHTNIYNFAYLEIVNNCVIIIKMIYQCPAAMLASSINLFVLRGSRDRMFRK